MRHKKLEGLTAVDREEFFRYLADDKEQIRTFLKLHNEHLIIYGGLVKRGFSASDVDLGLDYPGVDYAKELANIVKKKYIKRACPDCDIEPTRNPQPFARGVMHVDFEDIDKYSDNLDAFFKAFDATVDSHVKVFKETEIYYKMYDEVEGIIRDVVDTCSEKPDIDKALDCHRTQFHARREPLSREVKRFADELMGKPRPIRMRPE